MPSTPECELCQAASFTEWFYSDTVCWVAECDSCSVPMVVWREHDPSPPEHVRTQLHQRLTDVMTAQALAPFWIDENMRSIPSHYHAHARRRIEWTPS